MKSLSLIIQRDVIVKAVETVFRCLSLREAPCPVAGLSHALLHAESDARMGAHCRPMQRRSAHLVRTYQIMLSGSLERSDGLSPVVVTDLSYTLSDRSCATLTRTRSVRNVIARSLSSACVTTSPSGEEDAATLEVEEQELTNLTSKKAQKLWVQQQLPLVRLKVRVDLASQCPGLQSFFPAGICDR